MAVLGDVVAVEAADGGARRSESLEKPLASGAISEMGLEPAPDGRRQPSFHVLREQIDHVLAGLDSS